MPLDSSEFWQESFKPEPEKRKLPAAFETIKVSRHADDLIEAFKQAAFATGAVDTREQMVSAYSHLNVCAESLYKYIERTEAHARYFIQFPVVKRF